MAAVRFQHKATQFHNEMFTLGLCTSDDTMQTYKCMGDIEVGTRTADIKQAVHLSMPQLLSNFTKCSTSIHISLDLLSNSCICNSYEFYNTWRQISKIASDMKGHGHALLMWRMKAAKP